MILIPRLICVGRGTMVARPAVRIDLGGEARFLILSTQASVCRVSTVVVQRFCKPKVGGSNPSPGIPPWTSVALRHPKAVHRRNGRASSNRGADRESEWRHPGPKLKYCPKYYVQYA